MSKSLHSNVKRGGGREGGKGEEREYDFLTFGLYISVVIYLDIFIYSVRRLFFFTERHSCQFFWCIIRLSGHNHSYNATPLQTIYIEIFFICL
jgi:hypothetical protein